jgi:hypothetical protein
MFHLFKKTLQEQKLPYILLSGNHEKRMKTAIKEVGQLLNNTDNFQSA